MLPRVCSPRARRRELPTLVSHWSKKLEMSDTSVPDACVAVRYASRGSEAAPETESVDSVESKLLVIFYALTRTVRVH